MKVYSENDITVNEYCLEDWEQGNYLPEPGKTRRHNKTTGEISIHYLPVDQHILIKDKQMDLYNSRVISEVEKLKNCFEERWKGSENKDRLLGQEIEVYEKLFFEEKLRLSPFLSNVDCPIAIIQPRWEAPNFYKFLNKGKEDVEKLHDTIIYYGEKRYNTIEISEIRETYRMIIENGLKDFSKTNKDRNSDRHYILVESLYKYYEWLKQRKNTGNPKKPLINAESLSFKSLFKDICHYEKLMIGLLRENFIRDKGDNQLVWLDKKPSLATLLDMLLERNFFIEKIIKIDTAVKRSALRHFNIYREDGSDQIAGMISIDPKRNQAKRQKIDALKRSITF